MLNQKFDITKRCFEFGCLIVSTISKIPKTPAGYAIANQVIRSGTSVGANVVEAQDASSKKEFIRSMTIALKEARETIYWLSIINQTKLLSLAEIEACLNESKQIRSILGAIVTNSKKNS
ncbi:hypothetical protein A3D77_06330 [Candidatus Gottesmanbacteria bacterium RIFCSPHIGHO2_02_FULL_39_11]|uniref:Four helix bundle protein n=1 Tax=Candidatus Gottesmanbacteria bacterium RIFCSPHIGHO2_02_FULL_39_11 TaxID=1798382 RepID=A0A1F5ZNP4_9BACT|nr:MAG: hypothetical protein A3D77_06330 [Candidatus Gottesmanbacteria bacterium RIFCSPHIGHO2_02_FULL_39_11]